VDGGTDGGHTPHDARPGYLVGRFDRLVRRRFEDVLGAHGLTIAQYTALSVVAVRPGLSNAQLARRSLITAQGMNTVVTALERLGLVDRRPDANGGRRLPVAITDRGREVLASCDAGTSRVEDDLLSPLSPGERDEFLDMLQRLTAIGHHRPPDDAG
jgi:DNA-binding MarR family transcriptional regulator